MSDEHKNLELNNGQKAIYLYEDNFHRPVYELENGMKVCCTEMNGTFLHSMTPEHGEPDCPLKKEYQPKPKD